MFAKADHMAVSSLHRNKWWRRGDSVKNSSARFPFAFRISIFSCSFSYLENGERTAQSARLPVICRKGPFRPSAEELWM